MQILCAFGLVLFFSLTNFASATSVLDRADDVAACERAMSIDQVISSFVDFGQLIRDHGIDVAMHLTDISPTLARGRFLIVPLAGNEQLIVAMGAREYWQNKTDFGLFVTVTDHGHLARTVDELYRADLTRVSRVVGMAHGVPLDKVVEDDRLKLAYFHLRPNSDRLDRFANLVRSLMALGN